VVFAESEGDPRYHRAPCGLLATRDGVIVEANDTVAHQFGYATDALIGMLFTSLLDPGSRLFFETRQAQVLHLGGRANEVSLSLLHADGTSVPVLVNTAVDEAEDLVRIAVFVAVNRLAYERDLLRARRDAESAARRVRILQDISGAFSMSANDQEVAEAFVTAAHDAFAAAEASVLLFDDAGTPHLVAGANSLWGTVAPALALRQTREDVLLTVDDAGADYPELAAALREARFESLSVTPLGTDEEPLGLLVCFFRRAQEHTDELTELQRALGRQASQTLVRVRLQRRLERLALTDPLTGIANRQSVEHSLHAAIASAHADVLPLSVVFLDVDEFKAVNDTYGHAIGDLVLRAIADRLVHSVRGEDSVGRIGGDEFVAICRHADAAAAQVIAERIRVLCHDPIHTPAGPVDVSVSIGLSVYSPDTDGRPAPHDLLNRADGAMYASKEAGKDRVSLESRHPVA
jgi:diguanylate cyclase (GGDEF)-like protein/PAS domain S-box-containing protein